MKTINLKTKNKVLLLVACSIHFFSHEASFAQVCTDPAGVIYGLTGTANIHPITVSTGAVGAKINPNYPAPNGTTVFAPDLPNALGYSVLNGRLYYFKRNTLNSPQEFICYDPAVNAYFARAASPVTTIINLGCMNPAGNGYYCIDALGRLYFYRVPSNSWTTICTNIRDQYGTTLGSIIANGTLGPTSRIMGDMAFDGSGNLWILISGPNNFGIYKISANLPTSATASMTAVQQLPPTTPTPGLQSIGGVGFNTSGQMFVATNAGDNKIYRVENNLSLTYISTMTLDGIGTDLTSCNFPMFVLAESWKKFTATANAGADVQLSWTVAEHSSTKAYIIERSIDGVNWTPVATIDSRRKNGESSYIYNHRNGAAFKSYYRIVQEDYDDAKTFSQVKTIARQEKVQMELSLWPNPSSETVQFEMTDSQVDINSKMTVYDQWGRQLKGMTLQKGMNRIDIKSFPAGTYIVRIQQPNGAFVNGKFVKKNK